MNPAIRVIAGLVLSIICMVIWPRFTRLNSFFSLLLSSILFALIVGIPVLEIIPVMQSGFGSLMQQIGIIVALGSVLGAILENTGATEAISSGLLRATGSGRPVLAISIVGALVGIPVFCDSGFIILSRIIPSLAAKTSAHTGSLVLALASGLYTTHVLVPPTPGPLAAAGNLGIGNDLGIVMLIGLTGSIPVIFAAYLYARIYGSKMVITHEGQFSKQQNSIPLGRALLPLVLPIALIALGSFGKQIGGGSLISEILIIAGTPVIALLTGILLALTLINSSLHSDWPAWITQALKEAGLIILITGAGGSFGAVIKASGIEPLISSYASGSEVHGILFLCLAWTVAAIIKTAQGSSTSSMIITSALMAPLAASAGLTGTVDLSILVLSIGGGALAISHANDSYFWVVSQFGGMNTRDGLGYFSPMTLVQGLTALVTAILLFLLL